MATKQTDPNALIGRLIESRAVQGEPSVAEIAALADANRQMRERGQEREREGAASRDEPDQDQGTHAPGDWVRIEVVLTNEDAIALNDAAQLAAEESGELAHDCKIRLGQVIAALAADFLGWR